MTIRRETFLFLLSSSFFLIIVNLFPELFEGKLKYYLLCFLVAIFGLPHGALDTLEAKQNKMINNIRQFIIFKITYISIASTIFFIWNYISLIMLSSFLLISIWHFSEDWRNNISLFESLVIGTSVVFFPVFFNSQQVLDLYAFLSNSKNLILVVNCQIYITYFLFFLIVLIILKHFQKINLMLQVFIILISSYFLEPIYYFISYFCFFHSIKNYRESINKIRLKKANLIIFVNTLTIIILGFFLFIYYLEGELDDRLSNLIFIGLASLTVPHMLLKFLIRRKFSFF